MKCHHPARLDGNGLPRAGVAAGAGSFGPNLEIAKPGNFHVISVNQAVRNQIKKRIDHVLGFAFIESDLLKQQFGKVLLGQRRGFQAFYRKIHATVLLATFIVSGIRERSGPQAGTQLTLQIVEHRLNGRLNLLVCQFSGAA